MSDSITITNNRTGASVDIPIVNGGVDASGWRDVLPGVWFADFGLMTTASCESGITYLDGENGILRYQGYPIDQLAEKCTYLEVVYLLLHGELPNATQLEEWKKHILRHSFTHENLKKIVKAFHYDAHPMGIFTSMVAALSTFYPGSKDVHDPENRMHHIVRLVAKAPTIAAFAYRYSTGRPMVYPSTTLGFTENFLNMLWRVAEPHYDADPILARALDVLFILHADHEQNCSTTVMRSVASSMADPYVCTAAAAAALYGPRHGGANEAVLHMLKEIGSIENVPAFVEAVKQGNGRLQGFGHRVYKSYDPRVKVVREMADKVFAVTGKNPLLDIALALEEHALRDDYFISRKLYPNVDFYSGLIYQSMGFPTDMFTVLFAIPRTAGWLAHWDEMMRHPSKIVRPRQLYVGNELRDVPDLAAR